MKKFYNSILCQYVEEPVYIQEKARTLVRASFYIFFIIATGMVLHVMDRKPWVVIGADGLLLAAAVLTIPLVYTKHFELAANLIIGALIVVVILHNPVTDYLYATAVNYYRILETVIFYILIILSIASFVYKTYQIIVASASGFVVITLHYIVIIAKFYDGHADMTSLSLLIGYLMLFLVVCVISFQMLNTFHHLIGKLEVESVKVKSYNRELETRVKERTEALEKQNLELKKVNEEMDRFVYSVSHDLRAPLASVLGLINVARYETDINQMRTYLDLKEKSVKRLDSFIQDIISVSKNARLELKHEEVDMQVLIASIIEQYEYLENFSKIKKLVDVQQNHLFITDKYRVSMILNNLISNAIRYASPHRRSAFIKVSGHISAEKAIIEVADNGRGIAAEYLDKIFSMFFRANYDIIGSGLGLYIVKETVEKLQGQVKVTSALGKGSTFIVEIPNTYVIEH